MKRKPSHFYLVNQLQSSFRKRVRIMVGQRVLHLRWDGGCRSLVAVVRAGESTKVLKYPFDTLPIPLRTYVAFTLRLKKIMEIDWQSDIYFW